MKYDLMESLMHTGRVYSPLAGNRGFMCILLKTNSRKNNLQNDIWLGQKIKLCRDV
jgi:hypothetical protein